MPAQKRVKSASDRSLIVGVIATAAEFRLAAQMSHPPDLFELRLDCLFPAHDLENRLSRLPAPIIITARHPAEGGEHNLPLRVRRDLLLRFMAGALIFPHELLAQSIFQTRYLEILEVSLLNI
jgi:3-dehydroquinate dehydratase-1